MMRYTIKVRIGALAVTILAGAVLGAGCGGRTLGGSLNNNNSSGPDAGVIPDGAVPPVDGGTGGCAQERYQWLRAWRVDSLYLLQAEPAVEGQTVRIAVGMTFGGCQRLAQVDYEIDEAAQIVWITGFLWEDLGPEVTCPDVEVYGEEILSFPDLAYGDWRVVEATSGVPGMELAFHVDPCPFDVDCRCELPDPDPLGGYGDACQFNCQCDPSLQCLRHYGVAGPFSFCGRSCSVDADCARFERCDFTDDGPWGVCNPELEGVDLCPAGGCPAGFECIQNLNGGRDCAPTFSTFAEGRPCDCDADCAVGLRCIDFGGDAVPSCHAICRGDRECPSEVCGAELPDTPPLCLSFWM